MSARKKDQEIADPDHPEAERARIAPIEIGKAIRKQQQHGCDLQQRDDPPAPHGQRLGHQRQDRQDKAYAAHEQHDVDLMSL